MDFRYGFDYQGYEYWTVDRSTWADSEPITTVTSCTRLLDASKQTVESASAEIVDAGFGEQWVRGYMNVEQAGERARFPIGTWLAQKAEKRADGFANRYSAVMYSPLIVLANRTRSGNRPPLGYTVPAGARCVDTARRLMEAHGVAPVVASESVAVLEVPIVAGMQDSWLDVCCRLASAAGHHVTVDAMGRCVIAPDASAMNPSWAFYEGDGSEVVSMMSPVAVERYDTFDVPNAVEVIWTKGRVIVSGRAEDIAGRSTSLAGRGYEQAIRLENPPELQAGCTEERARMLAERRLRDEMTVTRTIEVTHAFCPVRVGDAVAVSYPSAGITGAGIVTRQTANFTVGATCTSTVEVREAVR